MKFADDFYAEVSSVDLYVFDTDGKFVTSVSRQVTGGFEIDLTDLPRGRYNLLAWGTAKDNKGFTVNHAATFKDFTCCINSDDNGHIRQDIGDLFYGRLDNVDMTFVEGRHKFTISLTKNTSKVKIELRSMSGAPINANDFDFTISDNNCLYAYDNLPIPDKGITYHPWELNNEPEGAVAAFTVGRLMVDRNKDALLTVRNSGDGSLTLQIPLIQYMLMAMKYYDDGPQGKAPMSDQEYLDRQDEYTMTFFLDEQGNWVKQIVYINSWRITLAN